MSMYTDSIDASCEAEGNAIERFHSEFFDGSVPQTRLQLAIEHARAAAALGIPRVTCPPYRWTASCKAHARINRAPLSYLVWGPPVSKRLPSTNDVQRRAEKRLRRYALLLKLIAEPGARQVGVAEASRLIGFGERTIQRAIAEGRLIAVRDNSPGPRNGLGVTGRYIVRIDALRTFAATHRKRRSRIAA